MKSTEGHEWVAPENTRLPDFIICGAMKCGTSTVHTLLSKHPHIYIPRPEINFFDIDDIFQHTDFYFRGDSHWIWPNIADAPQDYWNWYQKLFDDAPEDCLIGEDSTCYLPSAKASYRISIQPKPIKTIICLRQPTRRAYSQYLHMLRTGRALFNFEDTIKFTPSYVIERSMYLDQVRQFMRHIRRERIFFFILEEFLANKERVIRNLARFLSLNYDDFPEGVLDTHANKATIPRNIELHAFKNRMLRSFGGMQYIDNLPFSVKTKRSSFFARVVNGLHAIVNASRPRPIQKMDPATRRFLDRYFQKELQGLGDIVGIDLDQLWFSKDTKIPL